MEHTIHIKKIAWFLAVNFTLTYGIGLIVFLQGGLGKSPLQHTIMFIPLLSAFFVQKVVAREPLFKGGKLGFRIGKPFYLVITSIITFVILIAIYSATFLLNRDLLVSKDLLETYLSKANIPIQTASPLLALLVIFSLNLIVAPIINLPLFLGEEVGWRGFLYPSLIALVQKPGLVIGGGIWGLWHLPMLLMGLNYPTNPILGIPFMLVFCICWGIILQYFYQKSGSIFSVALAHGIMNWTGTTIMNFLVVEGKMNLFIEGPTGLIGLLIAGIVALYCYRKFPSQTQQADANAG